MATIIIPGKPKGKERPGFWKGHAVTPASTRAYEKIVKSIWLNEIGDTYHGAVAVDVRAYFEIPKRASKAVKAMMLAGERAPTKKPDADNIPKIIMDALNGVAYDDDKQVIDLHVRKQYAEEGYVEVEVKEV